LKELNNYEEFYHEPHEPTRKENEKDITQRRGGVEPLVRELLFEIISFYFHVSCFEDKITYYNENPTDKNSASSASLRLCVRSSRPIYMGKIFRI